MFFELQTSVRGHPAHFALPFFAFFIVTVVHLMAIITATAIIMYIMISCVMLLRLLKKREKVLLGPFLPFLYFILVDA